MHYGSYRFNCRFESEAQLPPYKGSTFRGVFGRALKQVVCALKRQECPDCLLKNQCLYPSVFEPHLMDSTGPQKSRAPIHPFVIQPPICEQTNYPAGTGFDFNLLLFGAANTRLPYFIYAMERMGHIGIGRKINGGRGAYSLESVQCNDQTIYAKSDQKITMPPPVRELNPAIESNAPCTRLTLTLVTPLRLKHNNHLAPTLPFHVLVRAMLRRISSLMKFFDGAEPDLDYTGLVRRAQAVQIENSALIWEDWRRYSLRQDQAMMMGGLKGVLTYSGDLGEYLPLIRFCAQVHLGKQTTFGLGRFTAEAAG